MRNRTFGMPASISATGFVVTQVNSHSGNVANMAFTAGVAKTQSPSAESLKKQIFMGIVFAIY
ncbi:hypothetical protein D210916BOD24_30310 [Alteromonas sp. D210916BOD_24]